MNLLISTCPGEHDYDKEFGCKIFDLDFERITSRTRWEGKFTEYIKEAISRYEKRLTNVDVRVQINDKIRQDTVLKHLRLRNRRKYGLQAISFKQEKGAVFIM